MPFQVFDRVRPGWEQLSAALDPTNRPVPPEIELRSQGGMPSQRLTIELALRSDGSATAHLSDRLTAREISQSSQPGKARIDVLRRAIAEAGVLRVDARLPRVPPDSITGDLRISDGPITARWYFVADVDQADAVSDPAPLEIFRAVGAMMALGKQVLSTDVIGPHLVGDGSGPICIALIAHDPPGSDVEGEHVVLYNLRPHPEPVGGFELLDRVGHSYRIPSGTVLGPHGILRIWTGYGTDTEVELHQRRKKAVWNNSGDIARLLTDQGSEVARRVYTVR